jgi:hypothetical protein
MALMERSQEHCAPGMSETAQNAGCNLQASSSESQRSVVETYAWVPILLWQPPRSRSNLNLVPAVGPTSEPTGIFDAKDLKIIVAAYSDACSFFTGDLNPTQRNSVALAIFSHARRGLIDRHRLAIKGIVAL